MAKMYPPYVEGEVNSGSLGEWVVFQELKKLPEDWVVIHDCWRYYMDRNRQLVNYELDFIVLVPGKGIAVIEVKNWSKAEVRDGVWWFMGLKGEWQKMHHKGSPLQQAFLGARRLDKELSQVRRLRSWYVDAERRRGRVEFGALAVLLRQRAQDVAPMVQQIEPDAASAREHGVPLEQLYICGVEDLRDHLQGKIERLFTGGERYLPLDSYRIGEIVQYLLPSFHLKGDPESCNRVMEDATADMHRLLPMLEESQGGIMVNGCAGSGKTWMAAHEIARLHKKHASEGCKILYLCYNVALAAHMRMLPEFAEGVRSGGIEVYTFEELCRRITGACFPDWESERRWYQALCDSSDTTVLEDVRRKIDEENRYDFIFIDECQDFLALWSGVIEALQKPGAGMFYFSDVRQNLFMTQPLYCPQAPTRVRLTRALRNTVEIARCGAAALGLSEEEMQPLDLYGGHLVVLRAEEDARKRGEQVSFWLNRLMRGRIEAKLRGVPEDQQDHRLTARPHQIVVLSPYAPYRQAAAPHPDCALPHVPMLTLRSAELPPAELQERWESDENIILGTTIRSFKGLEADYVILTDVDVPGSDHATTKNDVYVACTRAKYGLVIIPKSAAGEEYVKHLLSNVK